MPKFLNIFSRLEREVGSSMNLQDTDGNRFQARIVEDLGHDPTNLNEIPDTRNPGQTKLVNNWSRYYKVEIPDEYARSPNKKPRWSG